jgi:type II restriction enzyme
LVEIPKALLLEAGRGELQMAVNSKQFPKPGTCTVKDDKGRMKFLLYFDERKLQVRLIDKNLCVVHATWKFQEDVVSKE